MKRYEHIGSFNRDELTEFVETAGCQPWQKVG